MDEEHFVFVHRNTTSMTGPLKFSYERLSEAVIRFWNTASIVGESIRSKITRLLYGDVLRYDVTYWYGSTALAELGPPWLPLYAIFAYRPTADGQTEGLNIYVTPRRRGLGKLISQLAIAMTRVILRSGGREDAVIQNRIRFAVGPATFTNPPFAAFVKYIEEQPFSDFPKRTEP